MKVLHIITGLTVGGAEMMLFKLLSTMDRSEYPSEVICLSTNDVMGDRIRELGVTVHTLDMKSGLPTPASMLRMKRLIKDYQPDVVQTWLYHADLLGGVMAKMASNSKIVWNIRSGDLDFRNTTWHTYVSAKLCAWMSPWIPNTILSNSYEGQKTHAKAGYQDKKFRVIPNGFDTDVFKPNAKAKKALRKELGIEASSRIVGTVGRFHYQKDFKSFIKAAKMVCENHQDVHFCMCGLNVDKDNQTLMRWISEAGLQSRVHPLGRRGDIQQVIAAYDIFLSSSSCGEAFGNVIGEAMSCSVPCVVTDVGDSSIIVADTGRVTPPNQPEQLAAAVDNLLCLSTEELAEEGERSRQRVIDEYSLQAVTTAYSDFYQQLAATTSPSSAYKKA